MKLLLRRPAMENSIPDENELLSLRKDVASLLMMVRVISNRLDDMHFALYPMLEHMKR